MLVSILAQHHTQNANMLQYLIGVKLHNERLQKKAFDFLNVMGVTVSYCSVMDILNKAMKLPMIAAQKWKSDVERAAQVNF